MLSKSKKPTVAKEEPEICSICMDNYTPIIRKKIVCKYCGADSCSKCIERYLLDRIEDAHCLHCRVNYNDVTLNEICTKTYLKNTYFKHRQEILVARERANLPGLQEAAQQERRKRDDAEKISAIKKEIAVLNGEKEKILTQYNTIYTDYYTAMAAKKDVSGFRKTLDKLLEECEKYRQKIAIKQDEINRIRWPHAYGLGAVAGTTAEPEPEEKKKFIRRCTRDGCQGFLSTAWKCGICEYYSCSKCFITKTKKQDDPHECKKEDLETAEMIKKDSKPCPNCGEFIMKVSARQQMFCITCKTPWDWVTGKVVTTGIIHNPHYYEWMKRNGGQAPRNPADVPCGGYPAGWDLVRMPRGMNHKISSLFYEFHRICQELQDISTRNYRTHIDTDVANTTNIKFLLGDFDEKQWGQHLAKNERRRKRDSEVQEIFTAFRMVAVELINRVQNYNQGAINSFGRLPIPDAEKYITEWNVEAKALIDMMNDALRQVSINYSYAVPYFVVESGYYRIQTKNFTNEVKKKRGSTKDTDTVVSDEAEENQVVIDEEKEKAVVRAGCGGSTSATEPEPIKINSKYIHQHAQPNTVYKLDGDNFVEYGQFDEDGDLQVAIEASLAQK